nr:GntR family transcriptional regulator [Arsenicicoccus piscis]
MRGQLAEMIEAGTLPAGHRLPPIRQLAADLGLAPGTVGRVYKELEQSGLVRSRVRTGTVVEERAALRPSETRAEASAAARSYATAMMRLGLTQDDAVHAVRTAWTAVEPR